MPLVRELVDGWRRRKQPWHITWPIVYELLRVVSHPRMFRAPRALPIAWSYVRALLAVSSLSVLTATPAHADILQEIVDDSIDAGGQRAPRCSHRHAAARGNGVRTIYTRDADFHRFAGLEVVDSLAGKS